MLSQQSENRRVLGLIRMYAPEITQRGFVIGERYSVVYVSPETTPALVASALVACIDNETGAVEARVFSRLQDFHQYIDMIEWSEEDDD